MQGITEQGRKVKKQQQKKKKVKKQQKKKGGRESLALGVWLR